MNFLGVFWTMIIVIMVSLWIMFPFAMCMITLSALGFLVTWFFFDSKSYEYDDFYDLYSKEERDQL